MWLPIAASISCRTMRRSSCRPSQTPREQRPGVALLESIPSVYSATCRNLVADGCDFASRYCELYAAACVGAASGRLSDDPGADVLPWRESAGDGDDGDGPAGAPVWPAAGSEPDDLEQFGRDLGGGAAV